MTSRATLNPPRGSYPQVDLPTARFSDGMKPQTRLALETRGLATGTRPGPPFESVLASPQSGFTRVDGQLG